MKSHAAHYAALLRPTAGIFCALYAVDPAKVTRTALQNAASVAGLMLTTEGP